jgi:hypothetical protein
MCHPCVGKNLTNAANLVQHQSKCTKAIDSEDNCNLGKTWDIIPAKKDQQGGKKLDQYFSPEKNGIYCLLTSRKGLRKSVTLTSYAS